MAPVRRRGLAAVLAAAVTVLGLAGCAPAAAKRVTVRFWEGHAGGMLSADDAQTGTGTLSALIVCP